MGRALGNRLAEQEEVEEPARKVRIGIGVVAGKMKEEKYRERMGLGRWVVGWVLAKFRLVVEEIVVGFVGFEERKALI